MSEMPSTTPRTAGVNDEANRSRPSGNSVPLHSDDMPAVHDPQRLSPDVLSASPQGAGTIRSLTGEEQKVVEKLSCCGYTVNVAGVERKPFSDVFFGLDCSRSTGQRARVRLTVEQVDFGVENCCTQNCPTNQSCHKNCQTVFIHKIMIEVRPKSWAQDSHRMLLQPQHTPEVSASQRNSGFSYQIPVLCPVHASVTSQTGSSVGHSSPAFGWSPGHKDVGTKSVSWTWELQRFKNDRKLKFNKHEWRSRPSFGIGPSYTHTQPAASSGPVEASWELEVQPNLDLQQLRLEWDVKVTLYTAVFQSKGWLPGYSVTMGPTMIFEKLDMRIGKYI